MSHTVLIGIGTRPEAIKLAPVILELKKDDNFDVVVCATGQHKEMLDGVLDFFAIKPDINFSLMEKTNGILDLSAKLIHELNLYTEKIKPDLIIGQGDTTTAFTLALAAYYKKIPFAHVEAGLRTNNLFSPWPEEGNRKMISTIATMHFAPTEESRTNLINEGVDQDKVFVTGNTVIDALLHTSESVRKCPEVLRGIDFKKKIVLVTGHRRENIGENFRNIFEAIKELMSIHPEVQYVFPMHPSPAVRQSIDSVFGSEVAPSNLFLIEPLEYPNFVWLMKRSTLLLTDSGGIQEEAPSLGVPVLVTRDTTERPEGVAAGTVILVGANKLNIVSKVSELLTNEAVYRLMTDLKNPYGNGMSAKAIIDIIKKHENFND